MVPHAVGLRIRRGIKRSTRTRLQCMCVCVCVRCLLLTSKLDLPLVRRGRTQPGAPAWRVHNARLDRFLVVDGLRIGGSSSGALPFRFPVRRWTRRRWRRRRTSARPQVPGPLPGLDDTEGTTPHVVRRTQVATRECPTLFAVDDPRQLNLLCDCWNAPRGVAFVRASTPRVRDVVAAPREVRQLARGAARGNVLWLHAGNSH